MFVKNGIKLGLFDSAKIETSLDNYEKDEIPLYEKCGFKIEGMLENHFRYGDTVYLLGKTII